MGVLKRCGKCNKEKDLMAEYWSEFDEICCACESSLHSPHLMADSLPSISESIKGIIDVKSNHLDHYPNPNNEANEVIRLNNIMNTKFDSDNWYCDDHHYGDKCKCETQCEHCKEMHGFNGL